MIGVSRYLLITCFLALAIASCKSRIYVNVMHSAEIGIPADLDSLILIDRTKSIKTGSKVGNVLEGIITGEPIGGDRNAAEKSLIHAANVINDNERVTLVTRQVFSVPNINGTLKYEIPIRSEIIDSLANKHGADGVLALEYFDSDRQIVNGGGTPETFVWTYWRLYYPNSQEIIDEFEIRTAANGNYRYSTDLPMNYSTIVKAGAEGADRYLKRIIPSWYNEYRWHYIKGCEELKLSRAHFETGNWEQARYILEMGFSQQYSPKILGRIAFNLSVVYEQLELFDLALDYAYKSRETGNTEALRMIQILRTRINELPLINDQMIRE